MIGPIKDTAYWRIVYIIICYCEIIILKLKKQIEFLIRKQKDRDTE